MSLAGASWFATSHVKTVFKVCQAKNSSTFVVQHISVSFEMMAYSEEAGDSTNILNIMIGYSNVS